MQVIEAALAFAVTMLVLSLVSSSLVETVHRFLKIREAGLRYMLEQMFDQVLAQYAQRAGTPAAGQQIQKLREEFLLRMTANRAPGGVEPAPGLPAALPSAPRKRDWVSKLFGDNWFFGLLGGREMTKLTVTEFMERLGTQDLGNQVVAAVRGRTADALDTALQDIAQKFEAYGKEASIYFEGRARLLSVIVAIVVAMALHVDAYDLFRTYLRDPAVRTRVIEQADRSRQAYEEMIKSQAELRAKAAGVTDKEKKDVEIEFKELKESYAASVKKMRETETQLRDLGVPLGWTQERWDSFWYAARPAWYCVAAARKVEMPSGTSCPEGMRRGLEDEQNLRGIFWLLISFILAGLLIGLGSPFWYDAVNRLTSIRNVAQTGQGVVAPPGQAAGAAKPDDKEKLQPQTPVAVFKVAHEASGVGQTGHVPLAPPRPFLRSDGTVA